MGKGVLAIWHDVAEGSLAEVLHWYNREHHPERLEVPGFLAARRYRAVSGRPLLFIVYDVKDVGVLASKPYLDRVNAPTEWTSRCMPNFRDNSRTVCHVVERLGQGKGAYVATLRITPSALDNHELSCKINSLMKAFMESTGSVSAEYWRADVAYTTIQTDERRLRGAPDVVEDRVVVLTSSDRGLIASAAESAAAKLLADVAKDVIVGVYEMEFSLFN